MKAILVHLGWWLGVAGAASAAVVVKGTAASAAGLEGVVADFRALVGQGGSYNGVGGHFPDGRREVAWDAASLDSFQVPAALPGSFFNVLSPRGLELTTPGSLVVSGRAASGSSDVMFSTLNPGAAAQFQNFSPERLLAVYGATTVEATFAIPSSPSQPAVVRGFGAVFADISLYGSTRLEAFGRSGALLAAVDVPASPGGLSFSGIWIDGGEWIGRVRLTLGETGIDNPSETLDIVALDNLIYSEPQLIPEPRSTALIAAAAIALGRRRRRPTHTWGQTSYPTSYRSRTSNWPILRGAGVIRALRREP